MRARQQCNGAVEAGEPWGTGRLRQLARARPRFSPGATGGGGGNQLF